MSIPMPLVGLEFSVVDHAARAEYFMLQAAKFENDPALFNWYTLAATYSAVAIFEVAQGQFDRIYRKGDPVVFVDDAKQFVRWLKLLATLRVHDFHRNAVRLMDGHLSIHGPVRMKTGAQKNSVVGISLDPVTGRLNETKTRNASVVYDRPLQTRGLELFDFDSDTFVPLVQAIREYLADVKVLVSRRFPDVQWV